MDRKSKAVRFSLLLLLALAFSAPLRLAAQVPVDEYGQPLTALDDQGDAGAEVENILALTATELEELVGPVALYPDDLLAIVLPASTYPLEIVQAARFLDELGMDSSLQPDESWDESVVALLNYPEVVHMMDKEIDWTWRLGEAVISQQVDVIAAVESFRDRAYAAGNLESDEHQTVSNNDGAIEIDPVDEEIIYVPYYEPEEVVVYQPRRRVYYYYPQAYPVYYYPYPYGYSFASGYFWGVTTAYTIGWTNHYLHVHHPSYWGHPYYGRHYYGHYYRRPSISVYNSWYVRNSFRSSRYRHRDGDYWRPRHRSGARPATQSVRNTHYRSGGRDNERPDDRSGRRTRQDVQDRTRTQINANNNARSQSDSAANRSRQSSSGTRIRTAVANRDGDRRERGGSRSRDRNDVAINGRTDIQFRDRSGADRIRANRSSSGSNNAGRQRLTVGNSRQTITNTPANRSRQASQRSTPARQTRTTRTSSRSGASQRPSSRQTVQRQAPAQRQTSRPTVQRQASRPAVQRQAPAQRSAPAAAPQRRPNTRQSTSSSRRNHSPGQPRQPQ